jgi:hypothetical protein
MAPHALSPKLCMGGPSAAPRDQRENINRNVVKQFGDVPFAAVTRKKIIEGRERRQATPHQANNFVKSMRGLFRWAIDAELTTVDPTRDVKLLIVKSDGFHVWTDDEVARFEARWEIGTRERLAFDLLLHTGRRRSPWAPACQGRMVPYRRRKERSRCRGSPSAAVTTIDRRQPDWRSCVHCRRARQPDDTRSPSAIGFARHVRSLKLQSSRVGCARQGRHGPQRLAPRRRNSKPCLAALTTPCHRTIRARQTGCGLRATPCC